MEGRPRRPCGVGEAGEGEVGVTRRVNKEGEREALDTSMLMTSRLRDTGYYSAHCSLYQVLLCSLYCCLQPARFWSLQRIALWKRWETFMFVIRAVCVLMVAPGYYGVSA